MEGVFVFESQTLCIEYSCRHCGALCKVLNKYGQQMDTHERYGRATCSLLGRQCFAGDIAVAGNLVGGRSMPPTIRPSGDIETSRSRTPLSYNMSRIGGAKGFHPFATTVAQEGDPQRLRLGKQRPPRKPLQPTHIPRTASTPLCASCVSWCCLLIVPPVYSIATPHVTSPESQRARSWDGGNPQGDRTVDQGSGRPEVAERQRKRRT